MAGGGRIGGAGPRGQRDSTVSADASPAAGGRLSIELAHARGTHARWVLLGGGAGVACVVGLGTLGQGVGAVLLALAAWAGVKLLRTYLNPPGTIVVDGDHVVLPRGLSRGSPARYTRDQITAAYFLRRAVPWNHASPVLVIEVGEQAYAYPRDWFASEADQRRVLDALAPS